MSFYKLKEEQKSRVLSSLESLIDGFQQVFKIDTASRKGYKQKESSSNYGPCKKCNGNNGQRIEGFVSKNSKKPYYGKNHENRQFNNKKQSFNLEKITKDLTLLIKNINKNNVLKNVNSKNNNKIMKKEDFTKNLKKIPKSPEQFKNIKKEHLLKNQKNNIINKCQNFLGHKGRNFIYSIGEKFDPINEKPTNLDFLFRSFKYDRKDEKTFKEKILPLRQKIIHIFNLGIDRKRLNQGIILNIMSKANPRNFSENLNEEIITNNLNLMKKDLDEQIISRIIELSEIYLNDQNTLLLGYKLAVDIIHKQKRCEIWKYNELIKNHLENTFKNCNIIPRILAEDLENKFNKNNNNINLQMASDGIHSINNYAHAQYSEKIQIHSNSQLIQNNNENIIILNNNNNNNSNILNQNKLVYDNGDIAEEDNNNKSLIIKSKKRKIINDLNTSDLEEFPPIACVCNICNEHIENHNTLIGHMKRCINKKFADTKYICPQCNKEFEINKRESIVRHILEHQDFRLTPGLL